MISFRLINAPYLLKPPTKLGKLPVSVYPPHNALLSPLHHHLRHASRLGKIILGDQQVTLLFNAW